MHRLEIERDGLISFLTYSVSDESKLKPYGTRKFLNFSAAKGWEESS